MEKIEKFTKGILFSVGIFVLYYLICPNLFALLFKKFLTSDNFWISNFAFLGIYAFTFLILFLIVHKDILKQWKAFIKDPKRFLNKGFSYWGYGLIFMMLCNLLISSIVGNIAVNEQETRQLLFKAPLYALPTTIFFGPFLEELVFRLGFRKSFNKKIPFALCSAFVFGLLHVLAAIDSFTIANLMTHWKEFLFIIPYGSIGFFFAKAYYETDNIFSSIIPHMFHNAMSVFLIYLTQVL